MLSMDSHVCMYSCAYIIYKVSEKQSQTHYQHVNEYLEVTGPACACPALLTSGAIHYQSTRPVCASLLPGQGVQLPSLASLLSLPGV